MQNFWKLYGSRTLIILAVIGLIGAGVYGQLSFKTDVEPYLPIVMPNAASFKLLPGGSPATINFLYEALDANGQVIGLVTTGRGQGYGGPMTVVVAWTLDGTITNIAVPQINDTPAWYSKLGTAPTSDYYKQYIGRSYTEALQIGQDINVATGASHSSAGVAQGVQAGRELLSVYLGHPYPLPPTPIKVGMPEIMLLLGLAVVFSIRMIPTLRRLRWMRYLTLVFGLFVFGIILTIPLSLVNFLVFPLGYAPSLSTNLLAYLMVGGVVLLALVFGKNFYCFWLCPFVAIQEGMHFIGGSRVRPITKTQLVLRNSRYVILWLVTMAVLIVHKPAISVFEPWNTVFSLKGSAEQWILVVAVLGAAVFIYDFWCHYLCPVGATLDIFLKLRMGARDLVRRFSR